VDNENIERIAVLRLGGRNEPPIVGIGQARKQWFRQRERASFGSNSNFARLPRGDADDGGSAIGREPSGPTASSPPGATPCVGIFCRGGSHGQEEETNIRPGPAAKKREMHRYKRGTAKSGKGGRGGKVKSRKQAIAIALSKARKKGKKVPRKKK
jgi:Family of unknown function (DUF6496)